MCNDFSPFAVLVILAVPITASVLLVRWSLHIFGNWLKPCLVWQRVAIIIAFSGVVIYGGSKTLPSPLRELLTVLSDGSLTDLSGRVASGVQARAILDFVTQSGSMVDLADDAVEQARLECVALTNQLSTADYSVAYISLDLPRGTPVAPNHNIMVSFERVEQTASNLTAYVWFSEVPSTNVNVVVEYSLAEGVWAALAPQSNSYPTTHQVDGVECYKYSYAIPSGISGTPLKPKYEIEFGGFKPDQWLSIPEFGIVVEVGGVEHLPYTGWDEYSAGPDVLRVRYVGGIAVDASYNGVPYKGAIPNS